MIKLRYFLFISLIIQSCNAQETETEQALKKCVNERVNKNVEELFGKQPFDFYDFISEIENEFVQKDILKTSKKDGYLNLYVDILNSEKPMYVDAYEAQDSIIEKFGFKPFSTEAIFNQCPYITSSENKEGEGRLIYKQGSILNKMMAKGYDNRKLFEELLNSVDDKNFDKIVYRAPVILLIMINLDNKYNPDIKKMEEYRKGRTMDKN